MSNVFIYVLKDPRIEHSILSVRYSGKTRNPNKRLQQHLRDAKTSKHNNHRRAWILSLLAQRLMPVFEIVDEVPESEWQQWEVAHIEYFRECGCDLVNTAPGGESGPGLSGEQHYLFGRPERAPNRGKRFSPEWRENIRAAKLGVKNPNFGKTGKTCPIFGKLTKKNSSGFVGVSFHKDCQLWQSYFGHAGKNIRVGYFSKIEDAVLARALAVDVYLTRCESHASR